MHGFWKHLWMTLRLNFRNKQAVVFGYVVPIFFLIAYGSVFARSATMLTQCMGQLFTITIMGGACFGMPVSFVAERERGVWRRYKLTPLPAWGFVLSLLLARYLIVVSGALLQMAIAHWFYKVPWPVYPGQLFLAFSFASVAFLGLGLVICMVANSSGAVQALGQCLFLPMIMIGGVGVPLTFMQNKPIIHATVFMPGRYSVQAMDSTMYERKTSKPLPAKGLARQPYNLAALTLIGIGGFIAGAKLFRWENSQKLPAMAWAWGLVALLTWAAAGLGAEYLGIVNRISG